MDARFTSREQLLSKDGTFFLVDVGYGKEGGAQEGWIRFHAHEREVAAKVHGDLAASGKAPQAAFKTQVIAHSAGNDDQVQPIPSSLVKQAVQLFDLLPEDARWARESTVFRCMGGRIWLCNHGANLLCEKADTRRVIPEVASYCRENPNDSEVIGMALTGHGVNHFWNCVHGKPHITETEAVDERGFIANQWKRLDPEDIAKTQPSAPAPAVAPQRVEPAPAVDQQRGVNCTLPPYGDTEGAYRAFMVSFGNRIFQGDASKPLSAICRVKFYQDAGPRQGLHSLGLSDEFIETNTVMDIAVKATVELGRAAREFPDEREKSGRTP